MTKYTIDDCIFIAQYINQKNNITENGWYQLYSYFIYANCFAFSAFLFFLEYYLFGIIVFLINLGFFFFLGNKVTTESYKAFYRGFFGNDDFKETEVELFEDGVSCKSSEGNTFLNWHNFREIAETEGKIYLFTSATGITISKNSFEFETQIQEFRIFAKARMPQNFLK